MINMMRHTTPSSRNGAMIILLSSIEVNNNILYSIYYYLRGCGVVFKI